MQEQPDTEGSWSFPLLVTADLQDQVLSAKSDLQRLEGLLGDACRTLLQSFHDTRSMIESIPTADPQTRENALRQLSVAVTGLQFQDLATQLVGHVSARLTYCADRLANEAFGEDEEGATLLCEAPLRPNPVTQGEMDAGSIELF